MFLKQLFKAASLLVFILFLCAPLKSEEANKTIIRFGVFAYLGVEETKKQYQPIVDYLNNSLKNEVVILEVLPQEEIDKRIKEKTLDIITTNPTHYLVTRKEFPLTGIIATLVESEDGKPLRRLAGVIVVKADNKKINKLEDIKNKTIAAIGKTNLGGYRAQAYELKLAGVDLEQESKLLRVSTHQKVIKSVIDGKSDVGFARSGIIEKMIKNNEINLSQIKLINKKIDPHFNLLSSTNLYPEWPVFALPHVKDSTVRHLATALFALDPNSETAKKAGIYGFTIAADYLPVEDLTKTLRLPPFDKAPEFTFNDIWMKYKVLIISLAVALSIIIVLSLTLTWLLNKNKKEKRFKELLLSSLGDGVYGVDTNGICTFINDAALSMLGFKKEEVIGKNQHILFHHHYGNNNPYDECDCPIHKTTQDGLKRDIEEVFIRKNGDFFNVHLTINAIQLSQNVVVGAVVVFQDITERKKLESEIQKINENLHLMVIEETRKRVEKEKMLIQQSKMAMMGEMIGAIAHQWRQPLNALAIYIQDVHMAYDYNELTQEYIDEFQTSSMSIVQKMSKTIDDFRNFFKPIKEKTKFSLKVAVDGTLSIMGPQLKNHNINVNLALNEEQQTYGFQNELEQTILIILSNAQDVLLENNIKNPMINISIVKEEKKVIIKIQDNGGGVPLEIIDRIFEPYFTTKEQGKGTGIGLYMAKEIIERQMGGKISVENVDGGALFSIELDNI